MIRHTIKHHSSTIKFDPLITLCCGHFNAPYLKMLQVTGVASAFSYVRTCQRVKTSKNITNIRYFYAGLHLRQLDSNNIKLTHDLI